jgi:thymidine kinase
MANESGSETIVKTGSIEVICGPMFSGKTEELLRRLRRARFANQPIAIFKPVIDNRYSELNIVSHDANFYPSLLISKASDMLKNKGDARVVAFDEAQFFDESVVSVAEKLALGGIRVIASGLDMDSQGKPFGPMPALMAIADNVLKLNAICAVCGAEAIHSFRKTEHKDTIMVGAKDLYEPRCRKCFFEGM